MFHLVESIVWLFAASKWGDWRSWRKYYSTMLFMIVADLLYNFLTDGHPMWQYASTIFLPGHKLTNLLVMFMTYPAVVLVYLTNFPKRNWKRKISYVLIWVALWSFIEWLMTVFHLFTYYNGWSFGCSVLFDVAMFVILRVHFSRPLVAWLVSLVLIIFLLVCFRVPILSLP